MKIYIYIVYIYRFDRKASSRFVSDENELASALHPTCKNHYKSFDDFAIRLDN